MSGETAADWIAAASALLEGYRARLRPLGAALSPALRVVADSHPCPGYLHDDLTIRFCPPVARSAVERLRWTLFAGYMGCSSLDEATDFYRLALPLIVAHEAAHHLRISRDLASPSPFVEEQICDRLAVALVRDGPEAASLPELQRRCARLRGRLDERFARDPGAAFVDDEAELLREAGALGDDELRALEDAAGRGRLPLGALLALARRSEPGLLRDARQARARARAHVEAHYTSDPAAYWHLSLRWLEGYLRRSRGESLSAVFNAHLAAPPRSLAAVAPLEQALREAADPALREAAAAGLIEALGAAVIDDLADLAEEAPEASAPLVRAAARAAQARRASASPRALARLARAALPAAVADADGPAAALALRLVALADLPDAESAPLRLRAASLAADPAVARELLAAAPTAALTSALRQALSPAALAPAPSRQATGASSQAAPPQERVRAGLDAWLDALLAWKRPLPEEAWQTLASAPATPRLLRLAALHRRADAPLLAAAAAALRSAGPSTPLAGPEAAADLLAAADPAALLLALPRRGVPAHDAALALLAHAHDDRAPPEAPPTAALRAAAAAADLARRPSSDDPATRSASEALLSQAHALLSLAACAAASDHAAAPLARSLAQAEARSAAFEVIAALAAAHEAPTLVRLAEGPPALPPAIVSLLLDSLPDDPWGDDARARLRPLLESAPAPPSSHPPALASPALRMLIEAIASPSPGRYAGAPVLSLVERLVSLRAVPLFEQVDAAPLLSLAELTSEVRLPAGAALFHEGDPGDRLFVIQQGQMRIVTASGVELRTLGPPSCLGEVAVLDGQPRSATAVATTDCVLLALDGDAVRRVGHESPALFEALLRVMAARLRRATTPR